MEVDPFASVADAMTESDEDDAESHDRFKIIDSVMVAVAAITIALIAWGTGIIANKSGDESSAAIASAVKLQQADFDSKLQSLQDHAGYLSARRSNLTGDLLFDYLNTSPGRSDAARPARLHQMTESWDVGLKLASDRFFSSRFARTEVTSSGALHERYDAQKQYEAGKADAARGDDLDAAAHVRGLDSLLSKQASLVGAIVVIGAAIWLLTLAYDTRPALRLYPAGLAAAVYLFGAGFASYTYWW